MVDHLERNNHLCQNQHGFRKGKSCLTQLLHHLDDVIFSILSANYVDAINLDYASQIKWSNGSNLSDLNDTTKLSLMAGFPFLLLYSVAFLRVQF